MTFHIAIPTRVPENLKLCLDALYAKETVTPDDITAVIDLEDVPAFQDPRCRYVVSTRHRDNAYVHYEAQRQGGDKDIIVCDDDVFLKTPGGFTELARIGQDWGMVMPSFYGDRCTHDMRHREGNAVREAHHLAFHCTFMRREIADGPGKIDPIYHGFGMQDCDQYVSLMLAGLKCAVADGVICYHGTEVSGGRLNPGWEIEHTQNHNAFGQKWGISGSDIPAFVAQHTRP